MLVSYINYKYKVFHWQWLTYVAGHEVLYSG